MDFDTIKKYPHYGAYQRIKKIKIAQCKDGAAFECLPKTYENYLNRISGLLCCCDDQNSCCYNGVITGSLCLNATLRVGLSGTARGFSIGAPLVASFGSLTPATTCEGYEVVQFIYASASGVLIPTPYTYNIQLKAMPSFDSSCCPVDSSGVMFNKIIATKGKNRIEMTLSDSTILFPSLHPNADFSFAWTSDKVKVSGDDLTTGKWCFKLYL